MGPLDRGVAFLLLGGGGRFFLYFLVRLLFFGGGLEIGCAPVFVYSETRWGHGMSRPRVGFDWEL